MTRKTIDDLPNEVLLNIFTYLNGSELKSCCLTQSRWNFLIGSSHLTMKKFVLNLKSDDLLIKDKLTELFQVLTRNYYSLHLDSQFSYTPLPPSSLPKILELHGAKLRRIKLSTSHVHQLGDLVKFTPLLEHLEIDRCVFVGTNPIHIPKIKHLTLVDDGDDIPDDIFSFDLESLEFSKVFNKERLLRMLMRLQSLRVLTVKKFPQLFDDEDTQTLHNVPFRLKKLRVEGDYATVHEYNPRNFEAFLKLQRDTLESFSVMGPCFTPTVAELLFTSPFKNLKSLEFSVTILSQEKSFYYAMPTMDNVRALKLHGIFRKADVSKIFMSKFPSLEALDIEEVGTTPMSSKFLKTIAACQQNLEHLSIQNLFKGTPLSLRFKNLKSFKTNKIYNLSIWMNFVLNHLTLEEITVSRLERIFTGESFKSLLELPNLKRVNFEGNYTLIKEVFDVLKEDRKGLKTANLEIDARHRIRINFPSEGTIWNCQEYEDILAEYVESKHL